MSEVDKEILNNPFISESFKSILMEIDELTERADELIAQLEAEESQSSA